MAGKRILTLTALAALALVAGCSSSKSPTAVDSTAPAVPTGLQLAVDNGIATLTWDPNPGDADFAGFRLARVNGSERTYLVGAPEVITSFLDPVPARGVRYSYELTSMDEVGNESACAMVSVTLGLRHGGPTPDDGLGMGPPAPGGIPVPRAPGGDRTQY